MRLPLCRILFGATLTLFIIALIAAAVSAQSNPTLFWVYDRNVRDSVFGYHDTRTQALDPEFANHDIEGMACINSTIYASSGMDGREPSSLYAVQVSGATVALNRIGTLAVNGTALYEVAALAEKDGSLWGFAGRGNKRGIIRIDPATATAELQVAYSLDVEAVEWLGDTLWLAAGNTLYTWQPNGAITKRFAITSARGDIEAMDVVDGLLWIGISGDSRGVIAVDPTNGQIVSGKGFAAPDDIEGLTFCDALPPVIPTATPTATNTATPVVPTPTMTTLPPVTPGNPSPTPTETPVIPTATPTATNTPALAAIGDYVWYDANADGAQGNDEAIVSGVKVTLLDSAGATISSTTTSFGGRYLFDNLTPSVYSLIFTAPSSCVWTTQDAGTDDTIDSDVDKVSGATIQTELSPGERDMTWDAGLLCVTQIDDDDAVEPTRQTLFLPLVRNR